MFLTRLVGMAKCWLIYIMGQGLQERKQAKRLNAQGELLHNKTQTKKVIQR
jgi:hypothetical protein